MIELNLLPKELRKKKKSSVSVTQLPILGMSIGLIVVFVAAHVLIAMLVINSKNLAAELSDKWDQMAPQKQKTEKVARDISDLEKRVYAVRKIARPNLSWTKLLNGLNQAVISNIWLSGLEFKVGNARSKSVVSKDVTLDITGYAFGRSEEATSLVAQFINSLETNKDFFGSFDVIELKNINNSQIDGEEVMMFRLECQFKEGIIVPIGKDRKKENEA